MSRVDRVSSRLELPNKIKEDAHIRKYIVRRMDGFVLTVYERVPHLADILVEENNSNGKLPTFFGEWRQWTPEEIKALNDAENKEREKRRKKPLSEILDKVKIKKSTSIEKLEAEIEEAESLLAALKRKVEE